MPILLALSVFGGGGGSAAAGPTVTATGPLDTATGKKIAAGSYHSCTRLDNGQVKCWGLNVFGQLGLGDTRARGDGATGDKLPTVDLGAGRTAVELAAGLYHTCARLDNGQVKCWGFNLLGQLGLGDTGSRGDQANEMGDKLPAVDLGAGRTVVELVAGTHHNCARLDNGRVKCWGDNLLGSLGLGDTNNRGDQAGEMGDKLPAVDLGAGRTAVELAAGSYHSCARLDNGRVKCWGYNGHGQLGLGDGNNRGDQANEMGDNLPAVDLGTGRAVVALAAGSNHTCAHLDNGQVKCWGVNNFGQLGLGDTNDRGDHADEMGNNLPVVDFGQDAGGTLPAF